MAFKGAFLWLAAEQINFPPAAGSLEQINKTTGALTDHSAGLSPFAFQTLYDAAHDHFWTSPAGGGAETVLAMYDGTGALLANPSNPAGENPYGIVITPTHLWAGNSGSSNCSRFDAVTGALISTTALVNFGPTSGVGTMLYDGSSVWCPYASPELAEIDDATGAVVNDFTVAGVTRFGGMVIAGGNIWATDFLSNNLYKMDFAGHVLATFSPISFESGPIAFDGAHLWILDFGGGLNVWDLAGHHLAGAIIGGGNPQWVSCDGTPNEAWVSMGSPDQVQHFRFTPTPPPAAGGILGTFTGLAGAGFILGGTK
jgi:hypothetical protein